MPKILLKALLQVYTENTAQEGVLYSYSFLLMETLLQKSWTYP